MLPKLPHNVRLLIGFVCALIYFPLFASTATGQQEGWQFFRGNRFDGHATNVRLAESWPTKGPPVLWSIDLGAGYSGFVGMSGRVYTQKQSLTGQYVVCLDAGSGETIWEHRYAWPYKAGSMYPGPRSTPTIAGERLFYTTPTGTLGCLKLETGTPIWEVDLAAKFNAPAIEFGYSCSPVCDNGRVIVPIGGPDAAMVALRQEDGEIIWNAGNYKVSYCSAMPISIDDHPIMVGYFKNDLVFFDSQTGKELNHWNVSRDYDEHSAWPIYQEPNLWISGPFRSGSQLLQLSFEEGHTRASQNLQVRKSCRMTLLLRCELRIDFMDLTYATFSPNLIDLTRAVPMY